MALPTVNGIFNADTNLIESPSTSTWADLTSWEDYTTWTGVPATQLTWLSDTIDLETTQYFNLQVSSVVNGTISELIVYTSTTGEFNGEETQTTITPGDTNIEGFYGQYAIVKITVDYVETLGPPTITSISTTATSERLELIQTDINSANLSGGLQAKELSIGRNASKVVSMFIQPHQPGGYFVDDYVADDYVETSPPVFSNIVDKDRNTPKVSFATYEGIYTNSVFDIKIAILPEQFCDDTGNILVR